MWNIACIDGQWLWCDATAGRGSSVEFGLRGFALTELDEQQYQWDPETIAPLLNENR